MKKKKLLEMRAAKQKRMKEILEAATNEERALNTEERDEFGTLEEEIRGIDETIKAMESMRNLEKEPEEPKKEEGSQEERDLETFESFLRGTAGETRADNMTSTDNGAVIPSSIANKIIEKVLDISPVFYDADRYNVKGTLTMKQPETLQWIMQKNLRKENPLPESSKAFHLPVSLAVRSRTFPRA